MTVATPSKCGVIYIIRPVITIGHHPLLHIVMYCYWSQLVNSNLSHRDSAVPTFVLLLETVSNGGLFRIVLSLLKAATLVITMKARPK